MRKLEYRPQAGSHDWEASPMLTGVYNGRTEEFETVNGPTYKFLIDVDGQEVGIFKTAMLASLLGQVPLGAKVEIVSTGRRIKTRSGGFMKVFEVSVED